MTASKCPSENWFNPLERKGVSEIKITTIVFIVRVRLTRLRDWNDWFEVSANAWIILEII